ncbi:HD-GYP domain-containing protein [Bacillus horti]|uniref:Nucleotidyltransferase with HDIG domain n=1 Tax=Caldalkalibacillus horti TaxID=77523 RepID=A0ABT9VTW0_9BACI|nr:HD-GYP domain-containing protein [Bacillus horti]MDQ0164423.1 putative nucleotidyltransferase with HDIG domain [Bacillus horti]
MRLISVDKCQLGMLVARAIRNESGQVLVQENVQLTERMIHRLQELDIQYLYIQDQRTSDLSIEEPLSQKTRAEAFSLIKGTFTGIMKQKSLKQVIDDPYFAKNFKSTVKNILYDIRNQKQIMNMLIHVQTTDHYTFEHSLNVTLYTLALASKLDYSEKQLIEIGVGAILHDVGKCLIPLSVLNKKGLLTEEEYTLIKAHTTIGFDMLRSIQEISLLSAHCAYQHHERIDGSGYPRGLTDHEIHEYSKIIAIADVYDALTTNRSYRAPMLPHLAFEQINAGAGTLFDERLVHLFKQTIAFYPLGMPVSLSNGERGVVVDHNKNHPGSPIVRILEGEDKGTLEEEKVIPLKYREIDLSKNTSIKIESLNI